MRKNLTCLCFRACVIVDFFKTAARLKRVQRQGWVDRLSLPRAESVADHSYSMAVMGMVVSELEGADPARTLKMILLHDLAESGVGDLTPGMVGPDEKRRLEDAEFEKILRELPGGMASEYRQIWQEYVKGVSAESRIVHQVDKLEMALQAAQYRTDGHPEGALEPFFESARAQVTNPLLREMLAGIEESCRKEARTS